MEFYFDEKRVYNHLVNEEQHFIFLSHNFQKNH